MRGLSLVVASGGHSSSQCAGLSLSRPLLLRSTGSRRAGSVVVAHRPSCSVACGIFPDQGLNPCPLHWQADSQPLHHQGSLVLPAFSRLDILVDVQWYLSVVFICTFLTTDVNFFSCARGHSYIFFGDSHTDGPETIFGEPCLKDAYAHQDRAFFSFFLNLFLAVLGLCFCARAFSSCGERGPLFIAVRRPLTVAASLVAEHRLQTRRLSSCGTRA